MSGLRCSECSCSSGMVYAGPDGRPLCVPCFVGSAKKAVPA